MAGSVYSVGQVTGYIRNLFTQDFLLRKISVRGEISNLKYHSSGHIYFSLKDEGAVLKAVMWKSSRQGLKVRLENGMRIVAEGKIDVYAPGGDYQLYAVSITPDGVGELYRQYEELKARLGEMGMFDDVYKRPIPPYCKRIGIVTAPTGAAIRDIEGIAARRNPGVTLYLYPALVQGEMASASICHAISVLDSMNLDCIIVGRGGGSIEDLWAFNEEETAYAIFNCATPVISAVGHQTDYTIADFVADRRAATPSEAAEIAVFDARSFAGMLTDYRARLDQIMDHSLQSKKSDLRLMKSRLESYDPSAQLDKNRNKLEHLKKELEQAMLMLMKEKKHRLMIDVSKLEACSPLKKLTGGYAYVTDEGGRPLNSVSEIKEDDLLKLRLKDGSLEASVTKISKS